MAKPWLLSELTYHEIKASLPEVVVLPFGATEPHNLHLPYATDTIEADVIGSAICEEAHKRGARVLCLPTIPYGTETNQMAFPFAMNLQPSTVQLILRDLVQSLERTGIKKCVILNSHGGNAFKGLIRELYGQTSVHLFVCNWYAIKEGYDEIFEAKEDHAGELETSILLHARPDLVHLSRADDGATRPLRFEALRNGWIEVSRPWHLLTTNSGSGCPHRATAEKGRKWLDILVDRLATFLVELSVSPIDDSFPFEPKGTK
ncbi:creatininase family protein [bacterium]|nr:creatininase family protein [bacterium]